MINKSEKLFPEWYSSLEEDKIQGCAVCKIISLYGTDEEVNAHLETHGIFKKDKELKQALSQLL